MGKLRLAVLFGGVSSEYEVSLVSAASVLRHLNPEAYEIIPVGITKKGRWLFYPGPYGAIEDGSWATCTDNVPCVLSPDRVTRGLIKFSDGAFSVQKIDCVLPILHGRNGEDGRLQGLLAMSGIPYVGCDPLSAAVCMDKQLTHTVLTAANIPNAPYITCLAGETESDEALIQRASVLTYPLFVKPANAGSSVGIRKVATPEALPDAVAFARMQDKKVIIEQGIVGLEVECAVLGNSDDPANPPFASVLGQIAPCNEFYDYEAKYVAQSRLTIPADLPEALSNKVRQMAVQAYLALGCNGLSRVDFFVNPETGAIILNEVNTLPGFTGISMYPKLMEASGLPYDRLLDRLVALALEKAATAGAF